MFNVHVRSFVLNTEHTPLSVELYTFISQFSPTIADSKLSILTNFTAIRKV